MTDLPENLPRDVLQNVVGVGFPRKVPHVVSHQCMQAPQQLFESCSVAALHQQNQNNVVLCGITEKLSLHI